MIWDWENYHYEALWTGTGFFRNLFFNGWHPVFPWLTFFLLGLWLARLKLGQRRTQVGLVLAGGSILGGVTWLSSIATELVAGADPEAIPLVGLSPIPPGPLYLAAGSALAALAIGCCLLLSSLVGDVRALRWLRVPGRQTLTLYVAHIILGMGLMESQGLIGAGSAGQALQWSGVFVAGAVVFSNLWRRALAHGPLEWIMRRLTSVR
ncbi:MAG: DUF418 domain-containing protein [Lysobacterales bacterium]